MGFFDSFVFSSPISYLYSSGLYDINSFYSKDFEIIDEYIQTLRNNKEFSKDFIRIKYVGHNKVSVRGQNIVRFEIEASIKKSSRKKKCYWV